MFLKPKHFIFKCRPNFESFCPLPRLLRAIVFSATKTPLHKFLRTPLGAGAKTLRLATLSLVYSTAEYCTPVWCCSAHTRLIDSVLNDALRIVTGCLRPTPRECRSQPAEQRERHSPWLTVDL